MSLIALFQDPPTSGYVTLCEYNTNYVSEDFERADLKKHVPAIHGLDYPVINMDKAGVKSGRSLSKSADENWNPFLACSEEVNIWKKLFHALISRGFMEMLQELKKNREEAPHWLTFLGNGVDSITALFGSLYGKAFPHLNLSREEMITAFSSISHWPSSPIRAFGWHPHISKFAIAWQDDHVQVYTLKSGVVPLLKHRQQQAVTCLAWRPLSASVLAVGCNTGIFIWTVDPISPVTRLGSSSVRHLSQTCHNPVTTISWSPNGQLLVSGSPADSTMMVWDVNMETATPLYRAGGGISLTCWSLDEQKLFIATPGSMFRIWETQTWTCEKWSNLAGRCKKEVFLGFNMYGYIFPATNHAFVMKKIAGVPNFCNTQKGCISARTSPTKSQIPTDESACWSPGGSIILFAVAEEPALYSLKFHDLFKGDTGEHASAIGAQMAVKAANLTPHYFTDGDDSVTVGGVVKTMTWDPLGERLAIIFEDDDGKAQEIIAIFKTRLKPIFEVIPSGFVRGPPDSFPELVAFQQNFSKGALLTVGWSDGSVTFIPLLFTPSENTSSVGRQSQNGVFNNGSIQGYTRYTE